MADDSNPVPPPGETPPPPSVVPGLPPPRPGPLEGNRPVEIVLNPRTPATRPAAAARSADTKAPPENKDSFREVVETIVFVVVLVLLLKTFLAEAFVIPTGSMATTLLGYHREIVCDKCGYHFLVNASKEGDPNCEYTNRLVHGLGGGAP